MLWWGWAWFSCGTEKLPVTYTCNTSNQQCQHMYSGPPSARCQIILSTVSGTWSNSLSFCLSLSSCLSFSIHLTLPVLHFQVKLILCHHTTTRLPALLPPALTELCTKKPFTSYLYFRESPIVSTGFTCDMWLPPPSKIKPFKPSPCPGVCSWV